MAVSTQMQVDSSRHYRRAMSRYDYAMASVGGVIGSGWLFGAMYSAQMAGPAAILSWIIGGILMIAIALPWCELGGLVPEAGSVARVPQMTHGSLVGGLASWAIAIGAVFAAPVESLAVVQYAGGYISGLYSSTAGQLTVLGTFVAGLMVLVFFTINYYGIRYLRGTNTVVTTIKWVVPTLAMITVLISGYSNGGGANLSRTSSGGFMPFGFHGVIAAVAVGGIVYAYSGFRQPLDLAAEGKNPQRDVPVALISTMLFALCLYTLLQLAFLVAVPAGDLGKGWAGINFSSPLAQLASGLGLGWLASILYVDGALSPSGSGNLFTGTASRLLYAVRKNGFYIKGFDKMSERGIPLVAQLIVLVLGILAILPVPSWHYLVELTSSLGLLTYAVGGPSLMVLRRIAPNRERKFSLGGWAGILGPACFVIGALMFYWFGWPTTLQTDIAMLVGLIVYFVYYSVFKFSPQDIKSGLWFIAMMVMVAVMSYLGSFGTGNLHVIAFPLDSIIVAVLALIIHYWGVASGYETQAWKDFVNKVNLDLVESDVAD